MTATPESIIKLVNALVKGSSDIERRQLQQYLIRKNIPWLPMRHVAELTGRTNHATILNTIRRVEASPFLSSWAEDLNVIINS